MIRKISLFFIYIFRSAILLAADQIDPKLSGDEVSNPANVHLSKITASQGFFKGLIGLSILIAGINVIYHLMNQTGQGKKAIIWLFMTIFVATIMLKFLIHG